MTIQSYRHLRYPQLTMMILFVLTLQLLLPAAGLQAAGLTVCPSGCPFSKIQDAIAAANPGDTIMIGAATYLENLTIDKDLILQGADQTSTIIDGQALASVVTIHPGKRVTIGNVTITHGLSSFGGGIFSREGSQVALTRSVIHNNRAYIRGGGLYGLEATIVTISDSTFSANQQVNDPGGNGGGGAIFVEPSSELVIRNSTIAGNVAGSQSSTNDEDGGGIVSFWSTLTIVNSTISGNAAPNRGGGIYSAGTMTLLNTTISGNAGSEGGGIINAGGDPSSLTLRNSIIGNSVSGGDCANVGLFSDGGYNIVEDGSCITASTSRNGDPLLDSLADNGGPTLTHALLFGSPALDGVGEGFCTVESDQRGVARPQPAGGLCDIGAFELALSNQPPDCLSAKPSVAMLWPPNSKFAAVHVLDVTDPDGDLVSITIDSIFQDEPVDAAGSGNTSPDGQGLGTTTAAVRAERVGNGNGRVYHISFTADDDNGGSCSGVVYVGMPHNKKDVPVDDGPLYDSTVMPQEVSAQNINENSNIFLPLIQKD